MIQSTGNNFGCGPVTLQDFLSGTCAVLNGKLTVDTSSPEYTAAPVLEIYLPALPIPRSCVTTCWLSARVTIEYPGLTRTYTLGTAVRTWLRDSTTLCIEKPGIYDGLDGVTLTLCTMYAVRGIRQTVVPYTPAEITPEYISGDIHAENIACAVGDGWCFLHLTINEFTSEIGDSIAIRLAGFPEDVSADICMAGGSNNTDRPGSSMAPGRIEGGVLTIPDLSGMPEATGYTPFIFMFAPRGSSRQGKLLSNP